MELVFIRHAEGEHTLNPPDSLHIANPSLTEKGEQQAAELRNQFPLAEQDVLLVSPVRRALQTAAIWGGDTKCRKIVHPMVAPRIFPPRPDAKTLPCDHIVDLKSVQIEFPSFEIGVPAESDLWTAGINVMPEDEFQKVASGFIKFCRGFQKETLYVVSHDGTITSYRQFIAGQNFTREDFLQETGWCRISC